MILNNFIPWYQNNPWQILKLHFCGKVLGGIATNAGGSGYNATQSANDAWLYMSERLSGKCCKKAKLI